jgi:uncharacterized protein YjbI with pentapeptide repeats
MKILKNIKIQIGSRIQSRWDKLGKYGQTPFLALLACIIVLISHDLISHIALFFIKKASWELIILVIFTAITMFIIVRISYILAQGIHVVIHTSIEFAQIFYANVTKPFRKKDTSEHSFRVVDAILKYFGIIATFTAGIGFVINYLGSQEHAKIDREKMLNELFYKAVEQMGSKDADVNLAGIYSLEQSAINFPKNQWKVVGLLANYIAQHPSNLDEAIILEALRKEYNEENSDKPSEKIDKELKSKLLQKWKSGSKSLAPYKKTDARVQAALRVLCRRKLEYDKDLFESIYDKYNEFNANYSDASNNRIIELTRSDLSNYDMTGCELFRVSLNYAVIDHTNMTKADLSKGYLNYASLIDTTLVEVDLERTELTGANLTSSILKNSNLAGANFTGANLQRSVLTNANLANATMIRTYLVSSYLKNANLTKANLTKSNLTKANLTGANLDQADLTEANLDMTNLTGSDLAGSRNLSKEQIKNGCYWKNANYNPQQHQELEIDKEESIDHQNKCNIQWKKNIKK